MRRTSRTLGLALSMTLLLVGCATIGPPQPPSLNLPKPPADLRATRKGELITLTWTVPSTTTDRETIRNLGPTFICRGPGEIIACDPPVGENRTAVKPGGATQRIQGTYTDTLPVRLENDSPSAFVTYAVKVQNRDGRAAGVSNQVHIPLAHTLPPPREFRAEVVKAGVVLSWSADPVSAPTADIQYLYRVYRHAEGSSEMALAGEIPAGSDNAFTLTDAGIEWEKTYYYHGAAVTRIRRESHSPLEIEGDDTPEIKVFADDVFPPAVPADLQAAFAGPGQKPSVDLIWAPVIDADLVGYNVYRREEGGTPVKLNGGLIKAPAYRDENVTSGKRYLYSVSAVDLRGNESRPSEEASEAVP